MPYMVEEREILFKSLILGSFVLLDGIGEWTEGPIFFDM